MRYLRKRHPVREIYIRNVRKNGQDQLTAELSYTTETSSSHTWHTQPVRMSLCTARQFAQSLHRIADELQAELDQFRAQIENRKP